jgi:6-pyruvoyltetrahydropterin/6-carboxytetrahydropterin synthase
VLGLQRDSLHLRHMQLRIELSPSQSCLS